jgi:DNA-directed RNA polymerase specialized sigma24 family protein
LHFRLVTYFRIRFPAEAEALADETIDRLARRLQDGTPVKNLAAYALGIARFVVLETNARQRKERDAAREMLQRMELGPDEPDPLLLLLRRCLSGFDADSAQLIMNYYALDPGIDRIEQRRKLARRLGMSRNALRNRALRIRIALEKRLRAQLAQDGGPE